jgi:digeranylgeranylglycerophospholipid reductase
MSLPVVVVGNGPAGSIAARKAAEEHDTVIVGMRERHIGCAGIISASGLERIGVDPRDSLLNSVRGARIFSPNGVEIRVDAGRPAAYVVDRKAFDRMLLHEAQDAGARFREDWAQRVGGDVLLKSGEKIQAERIIVAAGSNYSLQAASNIPRPREFLQGGQYEMSVDVDPDFVELYFNVPDFFSWIIPLGDRTRIGLCVKGNPRPHLDRFIKSLAKAGRMASDRVYEESFGVIPLFEPRLKTQFGNTILLGDSAGQVKATTGGGVIMGALAAKHCLKQDYERSWRAEIGGELKAHLLMYKALNRMSEAGKDRLFSIVAEYKSQLEREGDMDSAKKTLKGMLKNPGFACKTMLNLPYLLASILH